MLIDVILPTVTAYRRGVANLYNAKARAKYPAVESLRGAINESLMPRDCNNPKISTPLQQINTIKYFYKQNCNF